MTLEEHEASYLQMTENDYKGYVLSVETPAGVVGTYVIQNHVGRIAKQGSVHLGPRATREDGAIMAIREAYKNAPEGTRNFTVHTRDPRAAQVGEGRAVPTTSTRAA